MSSSELAISVHELSKTYHIATEAKRHSTIAETLIDRIRNPLARVQKNAFQALKNVSFNINRGEVVGIIGRNGAGKSTLLKILSQITEPTSGEIKLYGRVASLLEVGTGFHPELTGRENVFLNGTILGMKRHEIKAKFDEIVAFAEVGRFLDTPVKRYSSGMYMRLAFSVAAHLEPEILIVDEVLSVGDANFQKKCLNKMEDVGQEGRTVLFVSHNMPAVTRLCRRSILLDQGSVVRDGLSHEVISAFLSTDTGTGAHRQWNDISTAPGNEIVRLHYARVRTQDGETAEAVDIRQPVGIEIEYDVLKEGHHLTPNFHFFNKEGTCVFVVADTDRKWRDNPRPAGRFRTTAWIPGNLLAEGTLIVSVAISTMNPVIVHFYEREAIVLHVIDTTDGDSARGDYAGEIPGVIRPLLEWTNEYGHKDTHYNQQQVEGVAAG